MPATLITEHGGNAVLAKKGSWKCAGFLQKWLLCAKH